MWRAAFTLAAVSLAAQERFVPDEHRGRSIYELGVSASGNPIEATLAGGTRVPASVVACVNCHGPEGIGKPEGGVVPSNITWDALTKPYGSTHSDGRITPPYNEHFLIRAITMGIDSGGATLNAVMPRFQLSKEDAADLVCYIQSLARGGEPGVTESEVQIGVILPPITMPASRVVRQSLVNSIARVNRGGGIFGRSIALTFLEVPEDGNTGHHLAGDFLKANNTFAVVDASGMEFDRAVDATAHTPVIASSSSIDLGEASRNRYVFYLDGGLRQELDALVAFASEHASKQRRRVAIVSSEDQLSREAEKWLRERLAASEFSIDTKLSEADFVFWVRREKDGTFPETAASAKQTILIPGSLARPEHWAAQGNDTFAAFREASLQDALSPQSRSDERASWDRASAAAELMIEAITRAGRGLTREGLIAALESFRDVRTTLGSPVSFGPGRRIGMDKVVITKLDANARTFVPIERRLQ
jgi:ABC-type branched-subunit amino acid transport system substrate-binding protein